MVQSLCQLHFSRILKNPSNQIQSITPTKEDIHAMKYYFLLPTNKSDLRLVLLTVKLTVYKLGTTVFKRNFLEMQA